MRFACTIGVVAVLVASNQTPGPAFGQSRAFRASVDIVALTVTVTDGSRRHVIDLGADDFAVFEDGRRQELMFFQQTGVSLSVVLLLDTSASMQQTLPLAHEAAIGFSKQLGPNDVASVIDFDSSVHVRVGFTNDRFAIEHAIRSTEAGGSTALYTAVYVALKGFMHATPPGREREARRQAIILLSDGDDTSSLVEFEEVLDLAARSDATIYAIGLGTWTLIGTPRSHDTKYVLRRLAEQTGGRAFFPQDGRELARIYAEIKAELSSQYSLAYQSSNPRRDGQYRRVAVRVDRDGAVARTRPGYYAPK